MPALSAPSNIVSLNGRTVSRSPAEISAAIDAEHRRHASALDELYAERAGMRTGVPVAERRHTKGQAAGVLKMSERRLMRLIVRHHDAFPDRPRLAVQPAGMKHSPWIIYTDRVKAVIDSGEPY